MQIKEGVNIRGLNIKMRAVLMAADGIWQNFGQELVVTAGLDGKHSKWSLHYYGMAVDLRSRYFSDATKQIAADTLQEELGGDYDVVSHATHIHVEYDPDR